MKENKRKKRMIASLAVSVFALAMLIFVMCHFEKIRYPLKYQNIVSKYAEQYGVDPYLIYAFIHTESGFHPKAVSSAEARGLMQITEDTFEWLKMQIAPNEAITFDDLFDPDVNIQLGTYYVSRCMERYGDIATAAASYHSGWKTVDLLLEKEEYKKNDNTLLDFPHQQMNHYVQKIGNTYQKYLTIYSERG